MTEVPEYLLERSRERRRALGLLGDDGGAPAASSDGGASPAPVAAAPAPVAAAAPAAVESKPEPPKPDSPEVAAAKSRHKIPMWVLPVLFLLPVWGITYVQMMADEEVTEVTALSEGAQVYNARGCAGCHGAGGGGGVGYPFTEGSVLLTFPTIDPMLDWIAAGTTEWGVGNVIGDPNRPGGPHIAGARAVMPGFSQLSEHEIYAVARYVREQLGGEELAEADIEARDLVWEELGGGSGGAGGGGH
ncbi:MAG: c-type cytochrome [Acidimicrobiales bacterium]|nr:c-type cytochrome [Acidimicrobiales bacterium]